MLFPCSSVPQLANLTDMFGIPETQLKFIIEAWSQVCHHKFYIMVSMGFMIYKCSYIRCFHHSIVHQIIECRRVLKWTYAYGYYLDDKVKSEFFEYLQGLLFLFHVDIITGFIIACGNSWNISEFYVFDR